MSGALDRLARRRAQAQRRRTRRRIAAVLFAGAVVAVVAAVVAALSGGGDASPARHAAAPPGRGAPAVLTHSGPRSRPAARARPPVLPLRRLAGTPIVLSFAGPALPAYARDILREHRAAGVILFGDNVVSPDQLRALTGAVHRAGGRGAIVCVDQEGGSVRVVPFAAPLRPPPQQSTPALARASARAAARQLRREGVDVVLAPVLDVARPGAALAARAYPGGPEAVARLGTAALRGYRAGGIDATAKHFPGLGAAGRNTDDARVTVDRPAAELQATDLVPFRAAIKAGVPFVMASHARYPALDPDHIASQSPAILRRLLRGQLGFRGVVITDSLEARAVTSRSSVATAAVRSLSAGADLVLLTGPGSYRHVYRRLLARAGRSPAFRARLQDAAQRARTVIGRP